MVEAGGTVTTAVWRAKHLRGPWERPAHPQLTGTRHAWDEDNLCVMGATIAPDGRLAVTYAGYSYYNQSAQTDRLGIAFADPANAFAPDSWSKQPDAILTRGPSAWDGGAIHEHDLVRLPNGTCKSNSVQTLS